MRTLNGEQSTTERLKAAAQRLIAQHGVDGVTTRDLAKAAGQKNMASLHYYFGTKDRLIEQLVIDATIYMESRRADLLTQLIRSGIEISVRDIVGVLVKGGATRETDQERNRSFMRFVLALHPNYRHLFEHAIGNQHNKTYQKCFQMIRERVRSVPLPLLNTRLLFLSMTMMQLLAAREDAMDGSPTARAYWGGQEMVENITDSLCGMLLAAEHSSIESNKVTAKRPVASPI